MFRRRPKLPTPAEWLVVGLGNPGAEYARTRHNVGFETIQRLAERFGIALTTRKYRAAFGQGIVAEHQTVLAMPLTFMNASGESVVQLLRSLQLTPERLVVVADELDVPVGRLRFRAHGGAGGHNGHRSIQNSLKTDRYARVKIGIGKGEGQGADHVLSRFKPEERALIDEAIDGAIERVLHWIRTGGNAPPQDGDES